MAYPPLAVPQAQAPQFPGRVEREGGPPGVPGTRVWVWHCSMLRGRPHGGLSLHSPGAARRCPWGQPLWTPEEPAPRPASWKCCEWRPHTLSPHRRGGVVSPGHPAEASRRTGGTARCLHGPALADRALDTGRDTPSIRLSCWPHPADHSLLAQNVPGRTPPAACSKRLVCSPFCLCP